MGAEVERREALWTFGRESRQQPFNAGPGACRTPSSASKRAETDLKLDISSYPANILLEPTQRRQLSCGWRQTGLGSRNLIGPWRRRQHAARQVRIDESFMRTAIEGVLRRCMAPSIYVGVGPLRTQKRRRCAARECEGAEDRGAVSASWGRPSVAPPSGARAARNPARSRSRSRGRRSGPRVRAPR